MMAGVDDAMVLSEQFIAGIFGNLTEFVVRVGDVARRVGDGHDGMRVERVLDVAQFSNRSLNALLGLPPRVVARLQSLQPLDQLRPGQLGVVIHSNGGVYRSPPPGMKQNPTAQPGVPPSHTELRNPSKFLRVKIKSRTLTPSWFPSFASVKR